MNGVPEIRTDLLVRFPKNDRKDLDFGNVAEAGELLQRHLGLGRQAGQLPDHEVHYIIGVPLGVEAIEFPTPAHRVVIEAEEPLLGENKNKLNGEKRVAAPLALHPSRQRGGSGGQATQRVANQPSEVLSGERRKIDLPN